MIQFLVNSEKYIDYNDFKFTKTDRFQIYKNNLKLINTLVHKSTSLVFLKCLLYITVWSKKFNNMVTRTIKVQSLTPQNCYYPCGQIIKFCGSHSMYVTSRGIWRIWLVNCSSPQRFHPGCNHNFFLLVNTHSKSFTSGTEIEWLLDIRAQFSVLKQFEILNHIFLSSATSIHLKKNLHVTISLKNKQLLN